MKLEVNYIYTIYDIHKIYDANDSFTIILNTTNINIDNLESIFNEVDHIKIVDGENTRIYKNKYKLKSITVDIFNNTTTIHLHT